MPKAPSTHSVEGGVTALACGVDTVGAGSSEGPVIAVLLLLARLVLLLLVRLVSLVAARLVLLLLVRLVLLLLARLVRLLLDRLVLLLLARLVLLVAARLVLLLLARLVVLSELRGLGGLAIVPEGSSATPVALSASCGCTHFSMVGDGIISLTEQSPVHRADGKTHRDRLLNSEIMECLHAVVVPKPCKILYNCRTALWDGAQGEGQVSVCSAQQRLFGYPPCAHTQHDPQASGYHTFKATNPTAVPSWVSTKDLLSASCSLIRLAKKYAAYLNEGRSTTAEKGTPSALRQRVRYLLRHKSLVEALLLEQGDEVIKVFLLGATHAELCCSCHPGVSLPATKVNELGKQHPASGIKRDETCSTYPRKRCFPFTSEDDIVILSARDSHKAK